MPQFLRRAALAAFAAALLWAPLWAQDQPPPDGDDEPAQQQEPEGAPADAAAEGAEQGAADGGETGTAEDAADGTAAEDTADGTVADDADLDDPTYESDDDVFVPSEEIPVDEPIPFPSDI